MDHSVFIILFELIIFLLEIIEVIEEREHGREALVTMILIGSLNLALLKFLLLNVINRTFDAKSIHYLNVILLNLGTLLSDDCFEVFDLLS